MRLLFDQNLSRRLVARLADIWPEANHVSLVGLSSASDDQVWEYARASGCVIVTNDSDFNERSIMRGFPPKVIWLRLGNRTTRQVEAALRGRHAAIRAFIDDPNSGLLEIL